MGLFPALERRCEEPELMDSGAVGPEELERALAFLESCNRYLGGWDVLRAHLEPWSRRWEKGRLIRFLDVGTGAADLPRRLLAWGRAQGFDLHVTALDSDPLVVALARRRPAEPGLEIVHGDLRTLARAGRRFDYVLGSLLLHHIPEPQLDGALRDCDALAERGLLFSDLRRSRAGWLAVSALTAAAGRVSRHDGPLSVRRAFRESELDDAARLAGLDYLRARAHPPLRLALAGEKA